MRGYFAQNLVILQNLGIFLSFLEVFLQDFERCAKEIKKNLNFVLERFRKLIKIIPILGQNSQFWGPQHLCKRDTIVGVTISLI